MPKSSRRGGRQNSNLVAGVLLIWIIVFALAGSMTLVAASTMIDTSTIFPASENLGDNLPTQLDSPPDPKVANDGFAVDTPTPPAVEPTLIANTDNARTTDGNQSVFEATFTPSVLITPTPTFYLTQPVFSEGPIIIGYSVGGLPIEVYRFGTGPVKRMIVAGIHGGYEGNTVELADQLITYIYEHPEYIPPTVTFYILRNLNPDGYARAKGIEGRANNHHVDLNRNFPVNWASSWSRYGCWNYLKLTAGSEPGSEPETQALMAFVSQIRPGAIISYHSAALGIFPGGEPADPESVLLAETLAEASSYPYPPIETGCVYTGTLPDWAVSLGIPAVDLELHTHKFTDFEENLDVIRTIMNWRRE